ncbi:HTTM domain-containing protein [Streptomyces sp. TRM 70351]|uniref:HTTM domain-containing protein n=1 Tax=Streptomyces sp. TRM 70351 TaxID=3116552 RepID=UPI002E7C5062|nr:HTTM domain-containing protein [Streptomyces sp. TRM 70351]MEE1930064.1 HTTM domain-containing protein [Streptomyces sp. TRM 70351]
MTAPTPSPAEHPGEHPAEHPVPSAAPRPAPPRERLAARFDRALVRAFLRVTGSALGPYQSAVVRIGFAATWMFFLLREFPHRHELYGPDSPWSWSLAERLIGGNDAFTVLMWSDSTWWFETVYLAAVAASAALLLGWRTRTASVLFMTGVLSLQNRSVFMGDGGDNVIHLMAMYLVLTRCGQVWSLDARRAARRAAAGDDGRGPDPTGVLLWAVFGAVLVCVTVPGLLSLGWGLVFWGQWFVLAAWWGVRRFARQTTRTVCDALANLLHNSALLVIMAEVCLVYATAGWYKVQGSRWQDGTAVYYPLHLDYFTPWPALSETLGGNGTLVMLITYGTVITQVAFPFTLFNRRVKNVLLAVMMLEHASIAVVLGLPFFSLAMIAADAVFLPTVLLLWLGARASELAALTRRGLAVPRARPAVPGPRAASGAPPSGEAPSGEAPPSPEAAERLADEPGAR